MFALPDSNLTNVGEHHTCKQGTVINKYITL